MTTEPHVHTIIIVLSVTIPQTLARLTYKIFKLANVILNGLKVIIWHKEHNETRVKLLLMEASHAAQHAAENLIRLSYLCQCDSWSG